MSIQEELGFFRNKIEDLFGDKTGFQIIRNCFINEHVDWIVYGSYIWMKSHNFHLSKREFVEFDLICKQFI